MPIAHYRDQNNLSGPVEVRNKSFTTPTRLDRPVSWQRAARKAIPQIPDPKDRHWIMQTFDASLDIIMIEFLHVPTSRVARLAIRR